MKKFICCYIHEREVRMDHNLKKEEKQFIALIIGFIAVIIFGLMAMFISQFGGLEVLTPLHFAIGFIKAGIVFFICFFVFRLYGNGRRQRQIQKWEARGWKTTAYIGNVSTTYRYGVAESGPTKGNQQNYHVRYVYKVDDKDYYHDIVKEVERWESQITVWYDKNHPKRHVTSEYSESKRKYYGWVFTIVLTLAAFLSGFSS